MAKGYALAQLMFVDSGQRLLSYLPNTHNDLVVVENNGNGEQTIIHAHYAHPDQTPPEGEIIGYIVRGWVDLEGS